MAAAKTTEIMVASERVMSDSPPEGMVRSPRTSRPSAPASAKVMLANAENGKIRQYRLNLRPRFVVEGPDILT